MIGMLAEVWELYFFLLSCLTLRWSKYHEEWKEELLFLFARWHELCWHRHPEKFTIYQGKSMWFEDYDRVCLSNHVCTIQKHKSLTLQLSRWLKKRFFPLAGPESLSSTLRFQVNFEADKVFKLACFPLARFIALTSAADGTSWNRLLPWITNRRAA